MNNIIKGLLGLAVIWFVFSAIDGLGKYEGQTAEEWFNEYDYASAQVDDLHYALQEANDNIEEANSNIEKARDYTGATYEEMAFALFMLKTVDTVDEP